MPPTPQDDSARSEKNGAPPNSCEGCVPPDVGFEGSATALHDHLPTEPREGGIV